MASIIRSVIANPALFLGHQNIFLLSHMRANTSLFGHILGSNPDIEGYYEMHIGYYSWKSLWRQKVRHLLSHQAKPRSRYVFDKVLHSAHFVEPMILQRKSSKVIFMLRSPERSIKSIVTMYKKTDPGHEHANVQAAGQYYVDRVNALAKISEKIAGRFLYLDAESLVDNSDQVLADISGWLMLSTPLTTEYQTFRNTAKGTYGDNSDYIKSGKIQSSNNSYAEIGVPESSLNNAQMAYDSCRNKLLQLCAVAVSHDH